MILELVQKNYTKKDLKNDFRNFDIYMKNEDDITNLGEVTLPNSFGNHPISYLEFYQNFIEELSGNCSNFKPDFTKIECSFKDVYNNIYKKEKWDLNTFYKTSGTLEDDEEFTTIIEAPKKPVKTVTKDSTYYEFFVLNDNNEEESIFFLSYHNDKFNSLSFTYYNNDEWYIEKNGDCTQATHENGKNVKRYYRISDEDLTRLIFDLDNLADFDSMKKILNNIFENTVFFNDNRKESEKIFSKLFDEKSNLKISNEELEKYKNEIKERRKLLEGKYEVV